MMRRNTTLTLKNDTTITIADIDQHQVKFGIKAPKEVKINREGSTTGTG